MCAHKLDRSALSRKYALFSIYHVIFVRKSEVLFTSFPSAAKCTLVCILPTGGCLGLLF